MYKEDLALNNLRGLVCQKTQPILLCIPIYYQFLFHCVCVTGFYAVAEEAVCILRFGCVRSYHSGPEKTWEQWQ